MLRLRIGTAGYAYDSWRGGFYPPGTPAAEYLPYYATQFSTVEINSTFHRPPTRPQIDAMARRVPAEFVFSLKLPRSISHEFRADDIPAFRVAAERLQEWGQLAGLIVQFAETTHNQRDHRDWLSRIRSEFTAFPLAVEFRHISWDVPALLRWLAERQLDLVSVGVPDIPTLFPNGPRPTPRPYARLHTRRAANWHMPGPIRYDFDYPPEELEQWVAGLRAAAAAGATTGLVYFNNCVGIQATQNAAALITLLQHEPQIEVLAPPPGPRTLFDDVPAD
jgi:uncharacterized protein YecE (DUF72 family)